MESEESGCGIEVVLSLGSNYGDREKSVGAAIEWLRHQLTGFRASHIYETLPVGHPGNSYINAVVSGCYDGRLENLDSLCKKYEMAHGRDADARIRGIVPVDIDVVMACGDILRLRDFKCAFFQTGYQEIL